MKSISIVGLIGIFITIFASLYYTPPEKYTDPEGKTQYHEFGNSGRYVSSIGLWVLGMLLIGCWFHFAGNRGASKIAMFLAIIGQIILWIIVHGILIKWYTTNEISGGIVFVILLFSVSIVIALRSSKRIMKQRQYFSKYIKDEILERQDNKCAMCNDKLYYCHFDHSDGNRSNNSIHNCQALCANCHDLKTRRDQRKKQKK